MAQVDDNLAKAVTEGFRLAQMDIENQAQLLQAPDDVTLNFPDGTTYTGPGFQKISRLAGNSDMGVIGPIAQQIKDAQNDALTAKTEAEASAAAAAISEANTANSETAAALSETNAANSATASKASADASALSETHAKTSEDNAELSAAAALASQSAASVSATAADGSATAAASSAAAALASQNAAHTSEVNAAASATAAATSASQALGAQQAAESARASAQNALTDAQTARTGAEAAEALANTHADEARIQADRAEAKAQEFFDNSSLVTHIKISPFTENGATSDRADFDAMPLVNGVPLLQASTSGGMQINSNETCAKTDDLNAEVWKGKTFMVQKPTVTGSASSNNAPLAMAYDFAVCSDCYATWRPAGQTANGNQRVQMIYDRDYIWLRGYHAETKLWTTWKRIATQIQNDVTGKDLNTFLTTGQYTYTTAVNAPVIDPSEASTVYFLEVVATDEGQDVFQVMHSPKTNSRFDRYKIAGGAWSTWWNSTATFDVDTAKAGVDLNTLVNPGWWGVPLDTALNVPALVAADKTGQAILQVMGVSNGGTYQRLHNVKTGKIHNRYRDVNNAANAAAPWSAWREEAMLSATNAVPVAQGGTGAITGPAALTNLGAASLVANKFTGDQTVTGNVVINQGYRLEAAHIRMPCRAKAANITIAEYSAAKAADGTGSQLDARFEIYCTNAVDATKRTNMLTIDVVNSAAPASGATSNTGAVISVAGSMVLSGGLTVPSTVNQDGAPAASYKWTSLNSSTDANTKNLLRKFRGAGPATIWHETVQGSVYRLATGTTDAADVLTLNGNTKMVYNGVESAITGQQLRIEGSNAAGKIGFFIRTDGADTYFLLTNANVAASGSGATAKPAVNNAASGSYNNLRPFTIHNANGAVSIGNGLTVSGGLNVKTGGLTVTAGDVSVSGRVYGTAGLSSGNSALATFLVASGTAKAGYRNAKSILHAYSVMYPDGSSSPGIYIRNNANTAYAASLTCTQNADTWTLAGSLKISKGAWITNTTVVTSDRNLKSNIKSITGALSKIDAIDGVTFNYRADGAQGGGFIAQDVQAVLPEAVLREKNEEGAEGHLGLNYNAVSGLMLNAIKELKAEVLSLKAELAELKTKK